MSGWSKSAVNSCTWQLVQSDLFAACEQRTQNACTTVLGASMQIALYLWRPLYTVRTLHHHHVSTLLKLMIGGKRWLSPE